MKDPGLFHDTITMIAGVVARMDSDWMRWGLEKVAIPAVVSAVAVFMAFDRAQHAQELQVQLLKAEVHSQRELIVELKGQVGSMQSQMLELLKFQFSAEAAANQQARARR